METMAQTLVGLLNDRDRLAHLIQTMIQVGQVDSRNPQNHTVRCKLPNLDDMITSDLQVLTSRAGRNKEADLPDIGEEGVVLFLAGDLRIGFYLGSLFHSDNPPPTNDGDKWRQEFEGGAYIEADRGGKRIVINPGQGWEVLLGGDDPQAPQVARYGDEVRCKCGIGYIEGGSNKVRCK